MGLEVTLDSDGVLAAGGVLASKRGVLSACVVNGVVNGVASGVFTGVGIDASRVSAEAGVSAALSLPLSSSIWLSL